MCPDTLPEWEFIEVWDRIHDRIDTRRMNEKKLKNALSRQTVYDKKKGKRVLDGRCQTLVATGYPRAFIKYADDYPDSIIARDLWGLRRVETWKDKQDREVWRDEKGHFTRKPLILERAKPDREIRREKPSR